MTTICNVAAGHWSALLPQFSFVEAGSPYFAASFGFREENWSFEVYEEVVYVECEQGRWDSDIWGRNPPYEAERIKDFGLRLDRLLAGGGWFTPEDKGLPDGIAALLHWILRKVNSDKRK